MVGTKQELVRKEFWIIDKLTDYHETWRQLTPFPVYIITFILNLFMFTEKLQSVTRVLVYRTQTYWVSYQTIIITLKNFGLQKN